MKTIGLIGGLSWESTRHYYEIINETVKARLGGLYSAQCLIYSFNFAEIEALQKANQWDELTQIMIEVAQRLERGGADMILICANTMHKMADQVEAATNIPLLHIADATAQKIIADGYKRVGLLGTRYTMEHDFYRVRLAEKHGLEVLIPTDDERTIIHNVIYDELVQGIVRPESRTAYEQVIASLAARGAEAVILGCTEINMLITQENSVLPVFDTTVIHADAAVDAALEGIDAKA